MHDVIDVVSREIHEDVASLQQELLWRAWMVGKEDVGRYWVAYLACVDCGGGRNVGGIKSALEAAAQIDV